MSKLRVFGAALTALALAAPQAAPAQSDLAAVTSSGAVSSVMRVDLAGGGAVQQLSLPRGKSAIVELPVDARDVLVTNPKVADAVLRTPRRIYVLGVGGGQTDAIFFDAMGRRILSLDIRVDQDVGAVAQTINRLIPGAQVAVDSINDSIILSGHVNSLSDADKAVRVAQASVDDPKKVINMLGIAGKDQVMVKVRIVEMQRNAIKQLGFDTAAVLNQLGEPQYLFDKAASFGVNGGLVGGARGGWKVDTTKQPMLSGPCSFDPSDATCKFVVRDQSQAGNWDTATIGDTAGDPGLNKAESMFQAFERVGLARTLAEPNLTAISGESAKFLAGGEFPVPTGSDSDGKVTIEFKPFGVGLAFTPLVLSGGRISLKISSEVSELTNTGSFSLQGTGGFQTITIPALNVRRAETVVELPSGGSMMIAGLLREQTRQSIDSLPGMTNLPVLGTLFRSRDYLSGESELVVIVTPYLVQPTRPDQLQTPADGLQIASDWETILLGRLNRAYKAKPQPPGAASYGGPLGYVIE